MLNKMSGVHRDHFLGGGTAGVRKIDKNGKYKMKKSVQFVLNNSQ